MEEVKTKTKMKWKRLPRVRSIRKLSQDQQLTRRKIIILRAKNPPNPRVCVSRLHPPSQIYIYIYIQRTGIVSQFANSYREMLPPSVLPLRISVLQQLTVHRNVRGSFCV
ncbi:hypothetical protein I7I50_04743 [Histoplasma capsulatum G186AR]|uniref:Uncharacterized protein n=1 Tax=Ajellomyces capsulatus TaxID=5037 RepID=A0A8H7YQ04_AJECA|nr:hypothetical protein I7I52_05652 [Histoplasma capsulatum]QSS75566.1 hypothetical protein I7I50_04743 [Histoplasma capsulatum G186AR]